MKYISLTGGKYKAMVDDDMYDILSPQKWHYSKGYAITTSWNGKKCSTIRMHRIIMNAFKGSIVDHIDNNKLNNTRNNLRFCSASENIANKRFNDSRKKHSVYRGVGFRYDSAFSKPWVARIVHNYKYKHLGYFNTELEAAEAYNKAAEATYGEFAMLNELEATLQ